MFKLSIEFATIAALTSFVNKMGSDVIGGTITHNQPIAPDTGATPASEPAAPKTGKGSRGGKGGKSAKETEVAAPAAPSMSAPPTGSPFPAGPTSFAPGNTPAPAAPQHVPSAAPQQFNAGPVNAPMAQAPQAPIAPAPAAPVMQTPAAPIQQPVSAERQQWNDACVGLVQHLQQHGTAKGYTEQQLAQVLANSFAEAGCPMGSRISTISDAQVTAFYPILHKNVTAALQ